MLDISESLKKINSMSENEIVHIMEKNMDDAEIKTTEGKGKVIFSGLGYREDTPWIPDELRKQCTNADDWLGLILDVANGYDGYETVEGLKSLIDEITEYAHEARVCMRNGNYGR